MSSLLCISVRFLQPYSHGRGEYGVCEWPPSPLRLIQALVAASAGRWNQRRDLTHALPALHWLETLSPPRILAAEATECDGYRAYVPDNVADKVVTGWARGDDQASIAKYRVEKDVRPMLLLGDAVHYLYPIGASDLEHIEVLTEAARSITHVGWGIDMVSGDAGLLSSEQAARLPGVAWQPSAGEGTALRVHRAGSVDDFARRHSESLGRVTDDGFRPVAPLRVFDVVNYKRWDDPCARPWRVFELRNTDGSRARYPHRRLMHLAGMVRHLAKEAMMHDPPVGVGEDWVRAYVTGHATAGSPHRQFSYLPLPSIGHEHADPGVRRVMIAAPLGDGAWLDHLVRRLAGKQLKPEEGNEFGGGEPPLLMPMAKNTTDGVIRSYVDEGGIWHSFTPVVLPGHDDHKPEKTRALIERALRQSGIDQACDFEWSAHSRFAKSYSAHKYDKEKRPQGYLRPAYLNGLTAVHLMVRFKHEVPGPLVIGAGRHCGFGLMARA